MTTPRIEEQVQRISNLGLTNKLGISYNKEFLEETLHRALTEAHQAGALAVIREASKIVEEMMEDEEHWQPIVARIKALQDNK